MRRLHFRLGWILLVCLGLALAGCGSDKDAKDADANKDKAAASDSTKSGDTGSGSDKTPEKVDPHQPPAKANDDVKDGYEAGCASGTAMADHPGAAAKDAQVPTDDQRYAHNTDYKAGWDQGYFACYDYERNRSFFSNLF